MSSEAGCLRRDDLMGCVQLLCSPIISVKSAVSVEIRYTNVIYGFGHKVSVFAQK